MKILRINCYRKCANIKTFRNIKIWTDFATASEKLVFLIIYRRQTVQIYFQI